MKKKIFIYLLLLIISSTLSYSIISIFYTKNIINTILKENKNDIVLQNSKNKKTWTRKRRF